MRWIATILAGLMLTTCAFAEVQVALVPSSETVEPGEIFQVRIELTQAGSEFNAYSAVIEFDPQALIFLPKSPTSFQEGNYITSACGSRFHLFDAQTAQLEVTEVLLCGGLTLTGPGELYVLEFQALSSPTQTVISFADVEFLNAGFSVPTTSTSATVQVGSATDVANVIQPGLPRLDVAPNPFNPSTSVVVDAPQAGWQELSVFDARGHLVRALQSGHFDSGSRRITWNGRDKAGAVAAGGVYVVRFRTTSHSVARRVVLLK